MMKLLAWTLLFLIASNFVVRSMADEEPAAAKQEDDVDIIDEEEKLETGKEAPNATEVEEMDDEAGVQSPSTRDFQAVAFFPEHTDKKFFLGSEITFLFSVNNTGALTYNVSFIGAHFHSQYDFHYYIYNFTTRAVGALVAPGQQQTFEYRFKPDRVVDPMEFWTSVWVIYNDSDAKMWKATLFNSTIELVDKPSEMNLKRVFTYVLGASIVGLVGYAVLHMQTKKTKVLKTGSSKASSWEAKAYEPKPSPSAKSSKKKADVDKDE